MTELATRRILVRLLARHGASAIVVFDIDDFRRYEDAVGAETGARSLEVVTRVLSELVEKAGGAVHVLQRDRMLSALPSSTHDEAVMFAERCVDAIRERDIAFPEASASHAVRLSVTAAVLWIESHGDIDRFDSVANDLLRDGKSTGGNAIIHNR